MPPSPLTVAVVGATGVVGRTMIQVLNEREFPVGELRLLASGRSAGRTVDGRRPDAPDRRGGRRRRSTASTSRCSRPAPTVARARARRRPRAARPSIDNSSAWRMDPAMPLVVSQVNPDDLEGHEGIIANPNCSTMQLVPVLMALRDAVGIERVDRRHVPGGLRHGRRRDRGARGPGPGARRGRPKHASVYPTRSRSTRCPQIDVFLENGYTKEEWKVVTESRKILHLPDLADLVHGRPRARVRRATPRRSTSRPATPITPDGRASCSPRCRASSSRTIPSTTSTRWRPRPPAPTRSTSGRVRAGPVDPGRPGPRVLGRQRQPAQGRGDERGRDRRGARRARLGPAAALGRRPDRAATLRRPSLPCRVPPGTA